MHMYFYRRRLTVAGPFPPWGLEKSSCLIRDYCGPVVVAASFILAMANCLQAWHDHLELLLTYCRHCEDRTAVLGARLGDMSKG